MSTSEPSWRAIAISAASAFDSDYRNSRFSRGHLVPARDLSHSPAALHDSFLLSNAVPQNASMNSGKWRSLENHIRQLASELAPQGITANAIRAGVTDTPALQKIPRHEQIIADARRRNPSGRMTTPDDVARAIVALSHPDTYWITGNVIGVDGGEDIVG